MLIDLNVLYTILLFSIKPTKLCCGLSTKKMLLIRSFLLLVAGSCWHSVCSQNGEVGIDQNTSDEAQCITLLGLCARFDVTNGNISNCATTTCRRLLDIPWSPAHGTYQRLNGTYCEPNKTCQSGQCQASSSPLAVERGAWAEWMATTAPANCGGDGCLDDCHVIGQTRVRVQYRQCSNPFAKNGGSPCSFSSNIRALACGTATCTNGGLRPAADMAKCLLDNNQSHVDSVAQDADNECMLTCKLGTKEMRTNAFNGLQCEGVNSKTFYYSDNGRLIRSTNLGLIGICIQGLCADVKCSDEQTFAFAVDDCPGESWSQLRLCGYQQARVTQLKLFSVPLD
jgi:hypothetical protein